MGQGVRGLICSGSFRPPISYVFRSLGYRVLGLRPWSRACDARGRERSKVKREKGEEKAEERKEDGEKREEEKQAALT